MLLSPRPTPLLPSTGTGEYSPVTKASRPPPQPPSAFAPRAAVGNVAHQHQPSSSDVSTAMTNSASRDSPRRPSSSKRPQQPRNVVTPDLAQPDFSSSARSRESTSSIDRSQSRESFTSMNRNISRDSMSSRKASRQFVAKSKASRGHHRPHSSGHLVRTSSSGHKLSLLSMTHLNPRWETTNQMPKQQLIKPHPGAGNVVRRKALSMSTHDAPALPLMRRSVSDESARRLSRSTDTSSLLNRPRRSSNLSRETNLEPQTIYRPEFSVGDGDDEGSESDEEPLEMPIRRGKPLLEEQPIPIRKISDRSPPIPPTLQLRRPGQTSPAPSPLRSGLSEIPHQSPSQFAHLTQPGPGPVAPPYLNTAHAVATDLPYAPPIVGSASSARERITQLQHGEIPPDDIPHQTPSTEESPSDERKNVSLENTRYALSPEAHNMIRRLSNGPPGILRRPSSPSPPAMPSVWTRPERITRTMQKQVIYRDLEQEASEQRYAPPMITRPDSRTDNYFNPPVNNGPNTSFDDDPFLNTYPRLNSELRRITKELDNLKKFSDPVGDALKRLAERKGTPSPIVNAIRPQYNDSKSSLSSSWMKRFSPEKSTPPDTASERNSLPSRPKSSFSRSSTQTTQSSHDGQDLNVFEGEHESKLRELTRQLWYSWPEKPVRQESEEMEQTEGKSTETESSTTAATSVSPTEVRETRSQSPLERRTFGSGLRSTWGSALALAGFRPAS